MAMFLDNEKFRDRTAINSRNQQIQEDLSHLLNNLDAKKKYASNLEAIIDVLNSISILHLELTNLKVKPRRRGAVWKIRDP